MSDERTWAINEGAVEWDGESPVMRWHRFGGPQFIGGPLDGEPFVASKCKAVVMSVRTEGGRNAEYEIDDAGDLRFVGWRGWR